MCMADGLIRPTSMAQTGMISIAVDYGKTSIHVCADRAQLNPFGGVHGGCAAAVLDSAAISAIHTTLPAAVRLGPLILMQNC